MFSRDQLSAFERAHRDMPSLTAYVAGRSPGSRPSAWRDDLAQAVLAAERSLTEATPAMRDAFAGCVARLYDSLASSPSPDDVPGWAGFFPYAGDSHIERLPVEMPTQVTWSRGICVAPYVRALKQHRPAVVAIIGEASVTLDAYAEGELERLGASAVTGDADTAWLARELTMLAGGLAWVLVAGPRHLVLDVQHRLPEAVRTRSYTLSHVDADTSPDLLREAVARTVMAARREEDLQQVLDVLGRRDANGAGVSGPATEDALQEGSDVRVYVTGTFLRHDQQEAERLVRLALEHGSEVEYVSGAAAARLDEAGGIAALRRGLAAASGKELVTA